MWRFASLLGNDESPQVLESLDIDGIIKYMKSDVCENVFVMAGAGISTSAGIPDFRSPDTGLYANLARLNLPYPEAVFDINFFRRNPLPFYTLAHELAPGRFRPTPTHSFIRLLAEKNRLHTCFTQNIDTLERRGGVPASKIVEAHGSFAGQHCIECHASFPDDEMKHAIETHAIPRCKEKRCNGLVKPDIVFFGESLPPSFHKAIPHLRSADLLIVMGTSLTVHPFASLIGLVPPDCPRLLINLDHVGGWGSRVNDVACIMKTDEAVRLICEKLGWEKDLDRLWEGTADLVKPEPQVDAGDKKLDKGDGEPRDETDEQRLKSEVQRLTEVMEKQLNLTEEHNQRVRDELGLTSNGEGEKTVEKEAAVGEQDKEEVQQDAETTHSDAKSTDPGNTEKAEKVDPPVAVTSPAESKADDSVEDKAEKAGAEGKHETTEIVPVSSDPKDDKGAKSVESEGPNTKGVDAEADADKLIEPVKL